MTMNATFDDAAIEHARDVLEQVPDPEIPVVSIRELGILRDVRRASDGAIEIVITPTYSGCPAMSQIAEDVAHALEVAGLAPYRICTTLTPAWTTDWITDEALEKLRAYGIAPPSGQCGGGGAATTASVERPLAFIPQPLAAPLAAPRGSSRSSPACPRCGSAHTERLAQFGSTACKALYRCLDCREPFDYFKPY